MSRKTQVENATEIVLLGKTNSGKSSALKWFVEKKFDEDTEKTMTFTTTKLSLSLNVKDPTFKIWDTSGHERFIKTINVSFTNASLIVVFIDLTDIADCIDYLSNFKGKLPSDTRVTTIYTKSDLVKSEVIPTSEEIQSYQEQITNNLDIDAHRVHGYYIISSKTGDNIEAAFSNFPLEVKYKYIPAFTLPLTLLHTKNREKKDDTTSLSNPKITV